jgi:adenosylmethionine-8-amino-7-oxononanoate aminotransferase
MFGCEHWDLIPDVITMAKNITECYFPLSATIIRTELAEKMPRFMHVHTFTGHAVGCAAAMATIEIIEREKMVENAAEMGLYLLNGLKTLYKHPIVGEVRELGMLYGIELVRDKTTKEHFPLRDSIADKVAIRALDYAVFIRTAGRDIIELAPVLTITKKEADTIVNALDRSLTDAERDI